jgi:hypothetical protein
MPSVPRDRWSALVNAPFEGGYPTPQAAAELRDEIRFQRGVQLYDWALLAVALSTRARSISGRAAQRWRAGSGSGPKRWP